MFRTLVLLSAVAATAAGARAADDPKAIIAKAIRAHGGEEALTKLKGTEAKTTGKIDIPGVGETEFAQEVSTMLPDKIKDVIELSIAGQKIKIATMVSGDEVSIQANGNDVPLSDEIKASLNEAKHLLKVGRLVPLLKEKGIELSLFGEAKVEGKAAVGVTIAAKGEKDITLFFDTETGRIAKIERRTSPPGGAGEVLEERIVLEYQTGKDGIPMPKKVLVKHDGKKYVEADVESKMVEKIDDSEFKK
jgi:hypothetical protein